MKNVIWHPPTDQQLAEFAAKRAREGKKDRQPVFAPHCAWTAGVGYCRVCGAHHSA